MSVIRQARIDDAAVINRLSAALGYASLSDKVLAETLRTLPDSGPDRVWVYEDAGQVLGWLHVFCARRIASAAFMEIGGMAVDPGHRRQGVGTALVTQAGQWAATHKLSLRVRCNTTREDTHSFYVALGFKSFKQQTVFEISE